MYRPFALDFLRVLLLLASHIWFASCTAGVITQIYEYPNNTSSDIENIHVLPTGRILLSTFMTGNLLAINPFALNPVPRTVVAIDGPTALTGIAALPGGLFAVSGGNHSPFDFYEGSMSLFVVLLTDEEQPTGILVETIPVADTQMMNGLAALPYRPFTVLSADSIGGRILRIDTITKSVDVAWSDPALGLGNNTKLPLGVNGLKIVGDWLYFTNSAQGTFARVAIDANGDKKGTIEIIATLGAPANESYAYDDFALDMEGNAYVALHSTSVVKITPAGVQTVFAGGSASTALKSPSSVAMANDGQSIYVTTAGETIGDTVYGGQVLSIALC